MGTDIIIPPLGESVNEGTIARWVKKVGDPISVDETLVELETDKITLEINAPATGVLASINHDKGARVAVGDVIGTINKDDSAIKIAVSKAPEPDKSSQSKASSTLQAPAVDQASTVAAPAKSSAPTTTLADPRLKMPPAVNKLVAETGVDPLTITGSGKDGRLIKGDVLQAASTTPATISASVPLTPDMVTTTDREQRVPMSRLRQRIAERLKDAQNTAAMLTTFNEVDMTNLMAMRVHYKDAFEKKYGVRLGFMSAFVKACLVALKEIPAINAQIDGDDIVYKKYYDIGVAVSTSTGLVVPIIRNADKLGFADIEKTIQTLGLKAKDNKLALSDLTGGTFTITNGGVFGSLMSTPIINPPQSAILGMHKIQERPIAVHGKVEIRSMMYIALTYDHRLIDGREAVTFLVRVKECIENPERILLDI